MIPRIIHHTWKSKTDIPDNFSFWRNSFIELNPDFEFRLHDDADNRAIVAGFAPALLDIYDSLPQEIFRADFVRPIYLYRWGGIYADMDFQCLKPLSGYADRSGIYLGSMGTDLDFSHSIPNAMMASSPGEPFWLLYLALMVERARGYDAVPDPRLKQPEYVTGPVVLREACALFMRDRERAKSLCAQFCGTCRLDRSAEKDAANAIVIQPGHIWYPLNWKDSIHLMFRRDLMKSGRLPSIGEARELFPLSEAVTYWAHTR
jgi:mannosyltransferase OCH1-like enzyme